MKKLYRDQENAILGGVCAGISDYLRIDVTIVRVIFVAFAVIDGIGILAYLILWILLPVSQKQHNNNHESEKKDIESSEKTQPNYILGIVLITMGTVLLISNFVQQFHLVEKLWPLIFVAFGVGILLNHKQSK